MTWLSDSTELVSSGWLSSAYPGFGITGAAIPTSGSDGPPILANDVNLPAENNDEFRIVLTQTPAGLTSFVLNEDSSFSATGPAGTYSGTVEAFKNGVSFGFEGFTINLGASSTNMLRNLNQSFSGKRILSSNKVGVLASTIPSSGTNGPGYLYNDFSYPADNNLLVRGFVTTFPSAGTFFPNEDSSFIFSDAPPGVYSFTYDLYVNDENVGSATGTLNVSGAFATLSVSSDNDTTSLSAQVVPSSATISVTTDAATVVLSAQVIPFTSISVTALNDTTALSSSVVAIASLNLTDDTPVFGGFASSDNYTSLIVSEGPDLVNMLASSGVGGYIGAISEDDVFTGVAFSIVISDTSLNPTSDTSSVNISATGISPGVATLNTISDDSVMTGVVSAASVSDATFLVSANSDSTTLSASSYFAIASITVIGEDSLFTGSSTSPLQGSSATLLPNAHDDYVFMTAIGFEPPTSLGGQVRLPIPLAVDINGNVIILM